MRVSRDEAKYAIIGRHPETGWGAPLHWHDDLNHAETDLANLILEGGDCWILDTPEGRFNESDQSFVDVIMLLPYRQRNVNVTLTADRLKKLVKKIIVGG